VLRPEPSTGIWVPPAPPTQRFTWDTDEPCRANPTATGCCTDSIYENLWPHQRCLGQLDPPPKRGRAAEPLQLSQPDRILADELAEILRL